MNLENFEGFCDDDPPGMLLELADIPEAAAVPPVGVYVTVHDVVNYPFIYDAGCYILPNEEHNNNVVVPEPRDDAAQGVVGLNENVGEEGDSASEKKFSDSEDVQEDELWATAPLPISVQDEYEGKEDHDTLNQNGENKIEKREGREDEAGTADIEEEEKANERSGNVVPVPNALAYSFMKNDPQSQSRGAKAKITRRCTRKEESAVDNEPNGGEKELQKRQVSDSGVGSQDPEEDEESLMRVGERRATQQSTTATVQISNTLGMTLEFKEGTTCREIINSIIAKGRIPRGQLVALFDKRWHIILTDDDVIRKDSNVMLIINPRPQ